MGRTIRTIEHRLIRKPEHLVVQPFSRKLVGGMAATRTRNNFRTRISKVAFGLCAHAPGDNRECGSLGESAMTAMILVWAMILVLFGFTAEKSNETEFSR